VRLGNGLDDGEPEAVAPAGAGRAGEPLERVRQIVSRDTLSRCSSAAASTSSWSVSFPSRSASSPAEPSAALNAAGSSPPA